MPNDMMAIAQALKPELVARRRDLHRHPELGFEEERTAALVAAELHELGLQVTEGIGKTGVVGVFVGTRPGPTLLLRFDMDALPIMEESKAEYTSVVPGKMHACGHDGHVAIGLAVAKIMSERRREMAGSIKFVFQPAEEGQGGAAAMIRDGVLEDPRPDVALALHLWNQMTVGSVGVTPGPIMAASDRLTCSITGSGGHGALPHLARDPVVAACHIVTALQTVISRNVNPLETAVLTIGTLRAGDTFNAIPERAELSGTIRSFMPDVRETAAQRTREIVGGVASALGCSSEISIEEVNPAVVNDPAVTAVVKEAAEKIVGGNKVRCERMTGSDDMAFIMEHIPGCYFHVGSANPELGFHCAHHNPRFDFDESALVLATALMASAAARYVLGR
ncbi:MAG: amidohydrolase [Chloroflexi bacterium]|nr:amidohydrolase [Chloroflexota bacterium]